MDFDNEDLNKENDSLENSYYDSDYNGNEDLENNNDNVIQDVDNSNNPEFDENELLDDNEPEEGNPALGHSKINGAVHVLKGVANSKLAKFLLAHGWIIPLILAMIISLIIIVHFQMDFDLFGVGDPKPTYYSNTPTCGKVYLTWENPSYTEARQKVEKDYTPITDASLIDLEEEDQYGVRYTYKPYEYDEYISGIVWKDNYDAKDVDNEIVYEAMAIATRSRLLSELPDNCVVLKNYNEQASHFKELDGSEEKYNEILSAVAASQGMIIVRNDEILPAMYDAFLYNKKREEADESQKRVYFYHMAHKNNEESLKIHAHWVDDIEKVKGEKLPKVQTDEIKKMTSLSLYGARYLLEREDADYELFRILKYFYGQDIEFRTIDVKSVGGLIGGFVNGCYYWPVGSNDTTMLTDGNLYAKDDPATTNISSGFGNRKSPTAGASSNHQAIDISGGIDGVTNIIAVADGTVIESHDGCVAGDIDCGYKMGNYIRIDHGNGVVTRYAHMNRLTIHTGDVVKQGQVIGKMGKTGVVTGVHLDFQMTVNGEKVNPLNYISASQPRAENCVPYTPGGTISGTTGSYTGTSKEEFINFIAQYAVEDMHSSGILASVTIAQAIIESGWGKSSLSKNYNNFFGMKAGSSWSGLTIDLPTTECNGDDCYRTTATWRVYSSPLDSLKDHSRLLHNNRYNGVVGEKDYVKAITVIKNGGYATDPNYISTIVSVIESNNLSRFDKM